VETIKETSGCLTGMGQQSAPVQCWQAGGGDEDDKRQHNLYTDFFCNYI